MLRSLIGLRRACCCGSAPASAQPAVQSMDELYAAAKKEGQVVFGGAIKEEHVSQARGRVQPALSRHRGQIHPALDRADGAAGRSRAPRQPRELRPAQSHRAGRRGALDEAGLPRRGADPGHRQDAAGRPSIPNGFYAATSVTPMLGIYNTKALKPGEAPKSLKALVSRSEMEGQGRDLAADPRRHRRAAR